ncbi:MAG: TIM barrel protein [Promethearchaeota archaeon]
MVGQEISNFNFFSRFIPCHTVDFTSDKEVDGRKTITSTFLDTYPINDIGFEYVPLFKKLDGSSIKRGIHNYKATKRSLEDARGVNVHGTVHFPYTPDLSYFLGSDKLGTISRILSTHDKIVDIAVGAGLPVIVVHAGANITRDYWIKIKNNHGSKEGALERIASTLMKMVEIARERGYMGVISLENMPWPFDIPQFTFTNMLVEDFKIIFNLVSQAGGVIGRDIGLCLDLCHAWIISKAAAFFHERWIRDGVKTSPHGIFREDWNEFIKLRDQMLFISELGHAINHVHVADSAGVLKYERGKILEQPTEGEQLGIEGGYFNSSVFEEAFKQISGKASKSKKITCTLEIKDSNFENPVKTAQSLMLLGERYYKA